MQPEKMKQIDCELCLKHGRKGHKAAFQVEVETLTLRGEKRMTTVTRCAYCDTAQCGVCKTRTMQVNQKRCKKCGHDLIPKAKG